MIKEKDFWKQIKPYLPGRVYRIENSVDIGIPDVSGGYKDEITNKKSDYWIELKRCRNKRMLTPPERLCRESQLIWHFNRGKQGSLIYIAVRYEFAIIIYKWKNSFGNYELMFRLNKEKGKFNWPILTDFFKKNIIKESNNIK